MSVLSLIASWFRHELPPPPPPVQAKDGNREALFRAIEAQHRRALDAVKRELDPDAQHLIQSLRDDQRFRDHGKPDA